MTQLCFCSVHAALLHCSCVLSFLLFLQALHIVGRFFVTEALLIAYSFRLA